MTCIDDDSKETGSPKIDNTSGTVHLQHSLLFSNICELNRVTDVLSAGWLLFTHMDFVVS